MSRLGLRRQRFRIVVCIGEPWPPAERLLEEAARLAAGLEAELVAALVENPALLWSAALPFTRAVSRFGLANGDFEPRSARRAMELFAAELERLVARSAQRFALRWHCLRLELERSARQLRPGDVVVATPAVLRELLASAGRLVLPPGTSLLVRTGRAGPVVAVSAGEPRTLALLGRLAEEGDREFVLHLLGPPAAAEPLRGPIERLAVLPGVRIRRGAELDEVLNAAAADIIQQRAGAVLIDGALVERVAPCLLDAVEGRDGGETHPAGGADTDPSGTGEEPTA